MNRLVLAAALILICCARESIAATNNRPNDEIVVVGQRFHIGTPVVLWTDLGGYNAYGDSPDPTSQPSVLQLEKVRHIRAAPLTDAEVERVKKSGWTLDFLREKVDQFVIHYDVTGTSRRCFKVLQSRHLGVQFMLDLDGTIYQTMDLQEAAPHATSSNSRSVGVEIANMGGYRGGENGASILPLQEWYAREPGGAVRITIPQREGDGGIRTPNFVGHPARPQLVTGMIQGKIFRQFDFTPQQYESLIHLTAALCTVFPKITCDFPRQRLGVGPPTTQMTKLPPASPATQPTALATIGQPGVLIPHALTPEQLDGYQGVLGHYHVQLDKEDPGPAFQWDRVINAARNLMTQQARLANAQHRNQPARFIASPSTSDRGKP